MTPVSRLALWILLLVAGCTGGAETPDPPANWYVPYKIDCSASCPATHAQAELARCVAPHRSPDQTASCPVALTSECFCTARRELAGGAP